MEIKTVQPHMRLLFSINKNKRERGTVSDVEAEGEGKGVVGVGAGGKRVQNSIPVLIR